MARAWIRRRRATRRVQKEGSSSRRHAHPKRACGIAFVVVSMTLQALKFESRDWSNQNDSCSRCVVPERDLAVNRCSWIFFSRPSQKVTYVLRRSRRASFLVVVSLATSLEILWGIAHGLLHEFGRRRSFHGDCTSSHPFVVPLPFGKRSGCLGTGNLARNHSLRPSCETKLVPIRPTSFPDRFQVDP